MDEMVGWHHRLNGHEFMQTLGDGEGQRSLACCNPWGRKELDTTERLSTAHNIYLTKTVCLFTGSVLVFIRKILTHYPEAGKD